MDDESDAAEAAEMDGPELDVIRSCRTIRSRTRSPPALRMILSCTMKRRRSHSRKSRGRNRTMIDLDADDDP